MSNVVTQNRPATSAENFPCRRGSVACSLAICPLLEELGQHKTYGANSVVFFEGDEADHYFLITSGVLRSYKLLEDGRRQINRFIFAGDLIGYSISSNYSFTVEAVTPVSLIALRRPRVESAAEATPCLQRAIMKVVLSELDEMQDQLVILGRMNAEERVARFLSLLASRSITGLSAGYQVEIPMCRSDIADYLGLTIETVSRVLTRLRSENKIAMPSSKKIVLLDIDSLDPDCPHIAA